MANKERLGTFSEVCKVINLKKEYNGATSYVGSERFAIVTDLTEAELESAFHQDLIPYHPFVIITPEMYKVITESTRNDEREHKREFLYHDVYAIEDERIPSAPLSDPADIAESNDTYKHIIEEMLKLPGLQGRRMYQHYVQGLTIEEIASAEGVATISVYQSIQRAKKAMHKVFAESGVTAE